jgi:di/tricarboxylate transporter
MYFLFKYLLKSRLPNPLLDFYLEKQGASLYGLFYATCLYLPLQACGYLTSVNDFYLKLAAPVLCFSLIQPILRNLPQKSTYAKALIMGIAMAANVGGMASPISSPQNVIAVFNFKKNNM